MHAEETGWQEEFLQVCKDNSIEPVPNGKELLLVVPKTPSKEIQLKLKAMIPETYSIKYTESPRIFTTEGLRILVSQAGATTAEMEIKGHIIVLSIKSESPLLTEQDSGVWKALKGLLLKDQFVEGWKVTVNDMIMSEYNRKLSETLAKQTRPERDYCPTNDDIMNLKITLENCKDVNDFINSL